MIVTLRWIIYFNVLWRVCFVCMLLLYNMYVYTDIHTHKNDSVKRWTISVIYIADMQRNIMSIKERIEKVMMLHYVCAWSKELKDLFSEKKKKNGQVYFLSFRASFETRCSTFIFFFSCRQTEWQESNVEKWLVSAVVIVQSWDIKAQLTCWSVEKSKWFVNHCTWRARAHTHACTRARTFAVNFQLILHKTLTRSPRSKSYRSKDQYRYCMARVLRQNRRL